VAPKLTALVTTCGADEPKPEDLSGDVVDLVLKFEGRKEKIDRDISDITPSQVTVPIPRVILIDDASLSVATLT
jgi:hypothetical protein